MAERVLSLGHEAETVRLAEDIATILKPGDVIRLDGDLGVGKTSFARALLRAFADDDLLEVPSPTFTLVQTYEFPRLTIAHFDLYRLAHEDELEEIGFDDAIRAGAALVEWPDRAGDALPRDALTLRLTQGADIGARIATLHGPAPWIDRLDRTLAVRAFLTAHGWGDAMRRHVKSDASARSIDRVWKGDDSRIVMNHPPEADDGAGLARRVAHAAAKLAERTTAFAAIAIALRSIGFSAPRIDAHDDITGLILMEDFGDRFIAEGGEPVAERYCVAVDVLADLHALDLPAELADGSGGIHRLPTYDIDDLRVQLDPFLDWAFPRLLGRPAGAAERAAFHAAWRPCLIEILGHPKTWALRDYHSPNLMWLPDRHGAARVGLLDFQDAVWLHPAYDLASLAQDARVTIPPAMEEMLVAHYLAQRPGLDTDAFRRAYQILAAQRATRILGVFARLADRDGRPAYLAHYPRIAGYLNRSLAAPALAGVRDWMDRHVGVALQSFT
jgi:tRNA threonylcarbamoyl adenosine modification protein YjeE